MNTTTIIAIGQKFPLIKLVPDTDGTRTIPGDGFSGFMICFNRPSVQEIYRFKSSPLEYGVFCQNHIPYLVLNFGDWWVDGSFNVVGGGEDCTKWLQTKSNILNIYFVDSNTKLVKGIRSIGLNPLVTEQIKDACIMQSKMYHHIQAVQQEMERIERQYDTKDMIKNATMYPTNRK